MWHYARLPGAFDQAGDFAVGVRATTEEELVAALERARREKDQFHLIEAWLPNRDCSAGLRQLGEAFRRQQK